MVHYWVRRLHTREFFLVALLIFCLPSFFWHNPVSSCLQWHKFVLYDVLCVEKSWILVLELGGTASISLFDHIESLQRYSIVALSAKCTDKKKKRKKKTNSLGHNVQPGAFMQKWKMSIVLPSIILPISLAHNTGLWLMNINSVHTVQ